LGQKTFLRWIVKKGADVIDKTNPNDHTRRRYNRIAFLYDFLEAPMEHLRFDAWRKRLKAAIKGERALEVGVGTGKNLVYYPSHSAYIGYRFQTVNVCQSMAKGGELLLRNKFVFLP